MMFDHRRNSRSPAAALFALAVAGGACSGTASPREPPPSPDFVTSTYQQGRTLVLQNVAGTDTFRIALDTAWGGSIVEVSHNSVNFVNAHDPGREIQIGLYDGNAQYDTCGGCSGTFGWDPVQAGDRYGHGAATMASTHAPASLYTKVQPYQWYPDDKGGSMSQPVVTDVTIEQTVTPYAGHANTFQVHYVITHLGADEHANAHQEIPAVYANAQYDRFISYDGNTPWTGAAVGDHPFPKVGGKGGIHFTPERWGAFVNAQNVGITVFIPTELPYAVGFYNPGPDGPAGDGTNYFAPFMSLTIGPGFTAQGDYFVIAGDYRNARDIVYELHQAGAGAADNATPFGAINAPAQGITISGTIGVIGWAMDNVGVATVQFVVDGVVDGTATYASARTDVATEFPNAPVNVGFTYPFNTTKFTNGPHAVSAIVRDSAGNVAVFPSVSVIVAN